MITFCSDFGPADPYAAIVKGVVFSINPKAQIVDLSHELAAHDLRRAAFFIGSACPAFPRGTIHLCVVDPGVGSSRKPILLTTEKGIFVGPDNGIFGLIWKASVQKSAYWLRNEKYFFKGTSRTFDARDIFGPAAAYLSLGVSPEEFGPKLPSIRPLDLPAFLERKISGKKGKHFWGKIVYIDCFGNLTTNFPYRLWEGKSRVELKIGGITMKRLAANYAMIPKGKTKPLLGSFGFLEIAAGTSSAQKLLKARIGTPVELKLL